LVLAIVAIAGGTSANAQLVGELGILDLTANDGNNPATAAAWQDGDPYRLAFVTSTKRDTTATDMATYNTFVQDAANAAGLEDATWKVIGSTETISAKENSGTDPADGGAPIFLMDGTTLFALDNADVWNGANVALNLDENGEVVSSDVWAGTTSTGDIVANRYFGTTTPSKGASVVVELGRTGAGDQWIRIYNSGPTRQLPFYALSDPLTVGTGVPPDPDLPGDANDNGFVDDDDLAVLLSNWEQDPGTITTWALGDFTGDTDVDDDDLAVLLGNWTGPPPGGAAVPEPATLALLGLGGLSVLRRRRK